MVEFPYLFPKENLVLTQRSLEKQRERTPGRKEDRREGRRGEEGKVWKFLMENIHSKG